MRNEYLCCCVGGFSFVWHALFPHGHYTHVDESKESGHLMHSFLFLLSEQSSFFFPAHHTHLLHLFKGNKQYSTAGNLKSGAFVSFTGCTMWFLFYYLF